ncbi:MAG: GreA/GreB family elongation factor [Pyrinomonadaceae bacterium]|nr:GreA/GreB family elongation factor [Pyrinomonadaceae bacterium]
MTKVLTIYTTEIDRQRLGHLIQRVRNQGERENFSYINNLEEKLEYAEAVAPEQIPPDVVTMRSKVSFKDLDTNEVSTYSIVFPTEADYDSGKISILAPLATALLGYKCGDTVEFQAPSRLRRLKIEKILYQPEASGDLDL